MASLGSKWSRPGLGRSTLSFLLLTFVFSLLSSVDAQYFIVNQPSASTTWAMGSPYPFSWTKGLRDGIDTFDIELARFRDNGLIRIARDVPAKYKKLNILLQDVPAGDDYFLVCLNSTHSVVYATSSRFSITNSSSSQNPSPDPSAPTVTVSGPPDPLKGFAATLGASANSGGSLVLASANTGALGFGSILALIAACLGGVMTLW